MIERLLLAHARLVLRRPGLVVAFLIALTVGALALLPRFRVDPDVAALLPADSTSARLLREIAQEDGSRALFLLLRGEDLGERMPALVEALRASPFLDAVHATRSELLDQASSSPRLTQLSAAALEALGQRLSPAGRREALAESRALIAEDPLAGRQLVLHDPLGLRWLVEQARRELAPPGLDPHSPYLLWPERGLALLRVHGREKPFDVEFSRALLADIAQRLDGVGWEAFGGYDAAQRDAARIRGDLISSLVWSIPLLVMFLAWSSRSLVMPLLYVAPVLLAVLWALGYGGALLGPLTPLAISGAAILMGLGVDFALHYLDRYAQERSTGAHAPALERTHVGTGKPLLLGMASTLIAFLAISLGSAPGLAGFGLLLALGLLAGWVATLCLAPLLARRWVRPRALPPVPIAVRAAQRLLHSRAHAPVALAFSLAALGGWVLALTGGLEFDADARHLRPAEERFAVRVAELEAALGASPLGLLVLVPAERAPLESAAGIERLRAAGAVARATGELAQLVGPAQRARLAQFEEQSAGWFEGTLEELAAAGFRPEPFRPALEELARTIDAPAPSLDESATRRFEGREYHALTLYPATTPVDRNERAALRQRVRAELGADVLLLDLAGSGDEIGPLLARDLARSLGLWALLVLALLAGALRRVRDVLAAFAPVLAGLGLLLGALTLAGFPLHPGNLIALPLVLGLGVDDGIHLVARWREGRVDPLATTGASIWRTSVTTVIAFGSLATAATPAIASLGILAAVGALTCFATSVLVTPALLGRRVGGA